MSQMRFFNRRCSVCGSLSRQREMLSTNAFGSPDLDLRPPQMRRSTMPLWVQECPHCGYVSSFIEVKAKVDKELLNSEEYATCSGISFSSPLAVRFYKHYLISTVVGDDNAAFYAALHAAWACDDAGDVENAIHCRRLAIPMIERLIAASDNPTLRLQRADILRRAGMTDKVVAEYEKIDLGDEVLNKLAQFEVEASRRGDTACYTVEQALALRDKSDK